MDKTDYKKRAEELEADLKKKDSYIEHLEKLSEAYNNLADLFNKQLMDADRTLKANEIIRGMMEEERKRAEETVKAHENLERLRVEEMKTADQTVRAYDRLHDMTLQEQREADRTIQAHENLAEYGALEKKDADSVIRAREAAGTLSMKEIMERDKALENILAAIKKITSILDLNELLETILACMTDSVRAQRGILFLEDGTHLTPRIFRNMDRDEIKLEYFNLSYEVILSVAQKRRSRLEIGRKAVIGGTERVLSMLCVPLIYEGKLTGVLYADIVSESDNFREKDLYIAEIFSNEAAISIHNSMLYDKIRVQNRELLKLANMKNQILDHISKDLIDPVAAMNRKLEKSLKEEKSGPEEVNAVLAATSAQLQKLQNSVNKVFELKTLEGEVEDLFKDRILFPELLEAITTKHAEVIKNKKLAVSVNLGQDASDYQANKVVMNIIFDELISNAAFYNKAGGKISVKSYNRDGYLVFEIADTGYGIKPDDLDSIFLQFYRTEASVELNDKGAGLGLFMVRESVKYYGGDVSVRSEYGKGSVFTVRFLIH